MNKRLHLNLFWGSSSPLPAVLSSAAIIILASSRLAFAIVCAAALIWVYGLTAMIFTAARSIMPAYGRKVILLFLATFLSAIFTLALGLLNPLLVFGAAFFLLLIPPCFLGSGLFEAVESADPIEATSKALMEAITLSGIILAFALIREPLGMGTLSFPGGFHGVIELFNMGSDDAFAPLRILSVSGGGLLLLGYAMALYRFLNARAGNSSIEDNPMEGK